MSTEINRNGHSRNDASAATAEVLATLKERGLIQNVAEAATVLGIGGAADNGSRDNVSGTFTPAEITDNASVVLE